MKGPSQPSQVVRYQRALVYFLSEASRGLQYHRAVAINVATSCWVSEEGMLILVYPATITGNTDMTRRSSYVTHAKGILAYMGEAFSKQAGQIPRQERRRTEQKLLQLRSLGGSSAPSKESISPHPKIDFWKWHIQAGTHMAWTALI